MNILLWVFQVLLALHTAMGGIWKFSNSEQTVAALNSIPHTMWLGMGVFELVCAVGLLLPAINKSWTVLGPIAAVGIALDMLVYSAVYLFQGSSELGQLIYWVVVAAISMFIAFGRFKRKKKKR